MGNKPIEPLNEERLEKAEREVFLLTGLKEECVQRTNVQVGQHNGEPIYMRTVICDFDENEGKGKPTLVWVHGYGACSGYYFQIIKRLSKYFHLIMIDHVGLGASSRPDNFDLH